MSKEQDIDTLLENIRFYIQEEANRQQEDRHALLESKLKEAHVTIESFRMELQHIECAAPMRNYYFLVDNKPVQITCGSDRGSFHVDAMIFDEDHYKVCRQIDRGKFHEVVNAKARNK